MGAMKFSFQSSGGGVRVSLKANGIMEIRNLIWKGIVRCGLLLALWLTAAAQAQTTPTWTAYNDQYTGAGTASYTTAWNVFDTMGGAPGNTGPLLNIATGAELPATLTVESAGNLNGGTTSGKPNENTPAYNIFNGFIDWSSGPSATAPQIYAGAEIDYIFSGLDPNRRYEFIGTGVRGGNGGSYAIRWTLIELVGAVSYTPAHTTGSAAYDLNLPDTQVAINTGQNAATGDYASWENIQPNADGMFAIRCTQYAGPIPGGTAGGNYGYGLMAIRLREFNIAPSPAAITAQPASQTVLELSPATFHAAVQGNPAPALQWYRNQVPIAGATNDTYTLASARAQDNNAAFQMTAMNVLTNTTFSATSAVATLTVQLDKTAPVLLSTLPPAKAIVSSLASFELFFSKPVTGVDASDLLIDGAPATNMDRITPSQYLFRFPQPAPGIVQVAWSENHAIADTTFSSNLFAGAGWTVELNTNVAYAVMINEIMAANKHIRRDEDGDYSDWIELYNSASETVSIGGWFLTDDALNPAQWQFPPISLSPKSTLIVWASGKNRASSTAPLHTSFKLNKAGGYLALVLPDGIHVVSALDPSYPAQRTDVSYGRDRSNPALLGFFTTPTPGAPNATAGVDFSPDVRFSRDSGTFTSPFFVALSTTSTNATIRYTLGTNLPTASSPIYSDPIKVAGTVQIRARTFSPGLLPGDVESKDFILLDTSTTNMTGFSSSLPIVVFHNYGGGAVPVGENRGGYGQFSMIQVFDAKNGRSSLKAIPDLAVQGTIHRRGQSTLWNAKANLRVETTDEYGGGKSVPLLGMPEDNDWVFYGVDGFDKVLMHNPLTHEMYRQMGHYTIRTRFVEVFLKDDSGAPGPLTASDYNGLYVLEEKIKISKDRVNIDPLQPENTTAPSVTGGYLFSVDKDGTYPTLNAGNDYMRYLDPDGPTIDTPQRAPQMQYINNYLNAFYSALTGANWTNPATGYAAYIDVPSFIDFNLHQTMVFSADMLRISTYYCKPRNGKLTPASLWDFDRSFGTTYGDYRGFNPWRWHAATGDGGTDPFNASGTYSNPWYRTLFTDPDFWQKYIDRYQELRKTVYSIANVHGLINRFAAEVSEATTREYARWSDTRPDSGSVTGDGWTYNFPATGTWPSQVQFIKDWFAYRLTFMDTNFLDAPVLSRAGGLVAAGTPVAVMPASEAGSSLYYTLDGSDPRLPGGAISPKALFKNGPVTLAITNGVKIFARSRNPNHRNLTGANNPPISSPWSGVTSAIYYTAVPSLRITEILYHPGRPPAGNTNGAGEFEYIELTNTGDTPLSLAGFRLTNGIDFVFTATNRVTTLAAGARVLVVRDLAAFTSVQPSIAGIVAGEYGGNLNNGGNRLTLIGPVGEVVQDFAYDNAWYPSTDGLGFSLVAVDDNASFNAWTNKSQWRPSAFDGGSPGASDPAPATVLPVLVNEILANPIPPEDDAIELWNPNAAAVDIGNWYLSDNRSDPKKFMIPSGTTIPGNGFLVFQKTNSFGAPGVVNSMGATNAVFGLDANGEEVWLFSGDNAGRLTGYFHGSSYGPSAPGTSHGRYVISTGQEKCVAQRATLGASNAAPLVGLVVISEILFAPPNLIIGGLATRNERDEFIALHNATGRPVPLFDANNPASTWHIRDGLTFDFPAGVVMPPGGFLLVVGFSPEADPVSLADFRKYYGLSNNVPVFGPFEGQLDNAGDRLELRRTGVTNATSQHVESILVDQVEYRVTDPWPAGANGTGASLQRIDFAAFGNDPANWFVGDPLPGGVQPTEIPADIALAIESQSTQVRISWPDSNQSWKLEEAEALDSPSTWLPSSVAPVLEAGRWQAVVPLSSTNKYFRLRRP
jgi:hypothetical protein